MREWDRDIVDMVDLRAQLTEDQWEARGLNNVVIYNRKETVDG
jgi:hypothetical protein